MTQSSKKVEKKLDSKSTLRLVASILCNRKKVALFNFLAHITEPIEIEFGETQKLLKTRRGTIHWCAGMAASSGERFEYLYKAQAQLHSEHVHHHCALIPSHMVGV